MADVKARSYRVGLFILVFVLLLAGVLLGARPFLPAFLSPQAAPPAAERETLRLPVLPERFAGLQLVSSYSGPEAVRDILQLHRNEFPLLDGLIAQYAGGAEVTVWVSLSPTVEEAAGLMQQMVETMPASTVFTEESVFTLEGRQIYHVTGMGMDHYYYHEGLYVYWLAIGETAAPKDVLAAFLRSL
jgi:hypothetical protein